MLFISTMFAISGFIPQIIKVLKTKRSEDISIPAWVVWMICYLCTVSYAFFYTSDRVFFFFSLIETLFCLATIIVCLRYGSRRKN